MKLILWWSFASLLQVSEVCFCICFGVAQQQKTLQTMLLFVACMSGLSGHNGCSFFMFLCDTVSLCYYTSLDCPHTGGTCFMRIFICEVCAFDTHTHRPCIQVASCLYNLQATTRGHWFEWWTIFPPTHWNSPVYSQERGLPARIRLFCFQIGQIRLTGGVYFEPHTWAKNPLL